MQALADAGEARLWQDASLLELYRSDQARMPASFQRMIQRPQAVVQPKHADAVVQVLTACRQAGLTAIARGAGSNAFGGSLATGKAVVVDTRCLDQVRDVDADGNAWVEAGATWNRVQYALQQHGRLPLVHTTSQFSTVGGMVATGGFGLGSTAHGSIRDCCLEVEVARPDGLQVIPVEDAAELFRTDGQLGIVTALRLTTRPVPTESATVVRQADAYGDAIRIATDLADAPHVQTVLVYDRARVHELNRVLGDSVVPERATVIARFERTGGDPMRLPESDVDDVAVGVLWQQRHFPMRPLKLGPGLLGVELLFPAGQVGPFARWAAKALRPFDLHPANEAYVLPGGQVLNITTFLTDAAAKAYLAHVAQVARLTGKGIRMGATPYGGGLWNLPFAHRRHPDLADLRRRKRQVDPDRILNRGKSLDPPPRASRLGLFLRSPLGSLGPSMLRSVAPWMQYRQRSVRPRRQYEGHPGSQVSPPGGLGGGGFRDGIPVGGRLPMAGEPAPAGEGRPGGADGTNGHGGGSQGAGSAEAQTLDAHEYSDTACTRCAACIVVCPAFQHTGDERTTARGKLQFMARFAREPDSVTEEEAASLYQCIRCRACEDVCQTDLPLLAAFDDMESKLTDRFGFPREVVGDFLAGVEADEESQRLIDETRGVMDRPHVLMQNSGLEGASSPATRTAGPGGDGAW